MGIGSLKVCSRCGDPKQRSEFYAQSSSSDGLGVWCKSCVREYHQKRRAARGAAPRTPRANRAAVVRNAALIAATNRRAAALTATLTAAAQGTPTAPTPTDANDDDVVATDVTVTIHDPNAPVPTLTYRYTASSGLLRVWQTIQTARMANDPHPLNVIFLGPSGSGKTDGARHLAEISGLPFTKVDAPAMTEPEAWFGTREVISEDGTSVTVYRPSEFVRAITQPGVLFIDEFTRSRDEHRNIMLGLFDGTHTVTNPLTGEQVTKHPECYVIMAGNRGLNFTGTYAVDPAFMTRAIVLEFAYLSAADETRVAVERTGCAPDVANLFVRFANDARAKAASDPDFNPISTREVIAACLLTAHGLPIDLAAQVAILNGTSDEGGAGSVRHKLAAIWTGIRPTAKP